MNFLGDTIVAIATPAGHGGIGVIRLSGAESFPIAQQLFEPLQPTRSPWPSHVMLFGHVVHPQTREFVDEGLFVRMEAPHSYTGEEVVEVQTHGSPVVLDKILSACCVLGARLAGPGEFTKRAFLNGKMDLVQAEAVAELIHCESEAHACAARRRMQGNLSNILHELRKDVHVVLAELEADIDFPEDGVVDAQSEKLCQKIENICHGAHDLRRTYAANERLRNGFVVTLVGAPNVGKSSLFNALLAMDRAIVTDVPGTTRDILREELILEGRRVRLVDTAGLRSSGRDEIEKLGMERARKEMSQADLVLCVCDASLALSDEERQFLKEPQGNPLWLIWNKMDLAGKDSIDHKIVPTYCVSAYRGNGVQELREAIGKAALQATSVGQEGGIANDRQRELVDEFLQFMNQGRQAWEKGQSPELVAFEFQQAHRAISRLLGQDESMEEVLDQVFSQFCVGK